MFSGGVRGYYHEFCFFFVWRARLFIIINTIVSFVSFSGGSRGYSKLLILLRVLLLGGVRG